MLRGLAINKWVYYDEMARERECDDGRELPLRHDREVSDGLESMPSPGGRLSNLSRCFGTMTRSLSFTVTSCNRFWNLEHKNDDNYGPRRNVKNSWGFKLHYFLVG